MPYVRKTIRRRKPYRRSRKGYKRSRFARKKFSKSVPRSLKSGLYIPKQAYVKLPFTKVISVPQFTDTNYNLGIWGTGITCPLSLTASPANGDTFPLGLSQYSNFYQYYKVLGASCTVQINNGSLVTGSTEETYKSSYFCALLAAQGKPYETDTDSNWYKMFNTTTENLISYPGCSWKLMSPTAGSRSNIYLKAFRKTKSMLSVRDVRDMDELQGTLPGTDTAYPNGSNPYTINGVDDDNWFYLLRIDPQSTSTIPAGSLQIILKMKYYVQLYGRDFNNQATAVVG